MTACPRNDNRFLLRPQFRPALQKSVHPVSGLKINNTHQIQLNRPAIPAKQTASICGETNPMINR